MSKLLPIEVDFTFTQKQRPKNSKKKGKNSRWRQSRISDSHFVFAADGLKIAS